MHPIERLRYVARSGGLDHAEQAEETARALASFTDDHNGLVTACRRIVERHPTSGPLWSLCASVLASNDPRAAAIRVVTTLQADKTAAALAYELPDDGRVGVVGWPQLVGDALIRRGDMSCLVIDALGEGAGLVRRLEQVGTDAHEVSPTNLAGAVQASSIVLLEASAVGPEHFVAVAGSFAAAAVAAHTDAEVWLVVGENRVLPERLFQALARRLAHAGGDPWEHEEELVPLALVDKFCGCRGLEPLESVRRRADVPVVPELLKEVGQ